jgi:hypothetical protein
LPKRIEWAQGKRVDKEKRLLGSDLDQAQVRVIAFLANEFGVETESPALGQLVHAVGQFPRLGDQSFRNFRGGIAFRLHGRSHL